MFKLSLTLTINSVNHFNSFASEAFSFEYSLEMRFLLLLIGTKMHFGHLLFPLRYAIDLDDPVIPKSVKKNMSF